MHSIFLLCDFGIPYNKVLRLKYNNINFDTIVNNPKCLDSIFGIKGKIAEFIKVVTKYITNSKQKYSIYDLRYCGLSQSITELLVKNNISIDEIDESLIEKDFIGLSTYKKIMKSYNDFIVNYHIYRELNLELLFSMIKDIYNYNSFSIEQLEESIKNRNYDTTNLLSFVDELLKKRLLRKEDNNYSIIKPKLKEEINKIKNFEHKDIVLKKLSGRTLESIGNDYNVSRERIRQIVKKEIYKFTCTIEEEKYKDIFEKYDLECKLFCELFSENEYVYYYLKEKYKNGETEPSELIDNLNLDKRQLEILKRKYNIILYKDDNIVATKTNILIAILKKASKILSYDNIVEEYNKIIISNNLELETISESDFRNIDAILNRCSNVLCENGKNYRYYDFGSLDKRTIKLLQEMLNVDSGDYSTEFFFNNNQYLMKKINIKNEYELHNLLRKVIGNYNGKIIFSRMPDIFIDCTNKIVFIDNLIHELSPIGLDEFVDYVYQNYGHKNNTFRALLSSTFSKYITNGQIISESVEFSEEQIKVLNNELIEDIYSIKTIKELLTRLFDINDFTLINNLNMAKLGYKLRGNYIMRNTISNLEAYLGDIILSNDYYEINSEMKKIGSTYTSYIYNFIYNLDLFEIENGKYITIKKLNELGINKNDIKNYIQNIENVIQEGEYFNLYTLNKSNFINVLKSYNFPDCFYETIISTIDNIKSFTIQNNTVFIKTSEQVNSKDFINSFINKDKIFISEIKNEIINKYNINLYEYNIKEYVDKKKYYFDSSIDCIYKNKDYYEEDINNLDILKYIDQ